MQHSTAFQMIEADAETIASADGHYVRKVWRVTPEEGARERLYVFLDGEVYLREMNAVETVSGLMGSGRIPLGTCLFLSHESPEHRMGDFTCNDAFAQLVGEDLIDWATEREVVSASDGHVIAGVSLSGLMAAYVALRYGSAFSGALCQSGSFWWLKDREILLPTTRGRFWLSVGKKETANHVMHPGIIQEMSQIEGVQWAAEKIAELGGTVEFHRTAGRHTAATWQNDLGPGLEWLMQGADSPPGA